jgi:perosamine synthetase
MQGRYNYTMLGLNLRTTDVQSSIGRVQLQRLEGHLQLRQEIARIYKDELDGSYEFQRIPEYVTRHPYMIFYLLARDKVQRDRIIDTLSKNGVGTRICWPPTHVQPYHRKLFDSDYPNSDDIYARSVALPMGNGLTIEQGTHVARLVKGA